MGHSVSAHTQTYHGAMLEREYQEAWERVVKGRQLKTCQQAGIRYRPPYTARHTLLSHGIEYEGWSLPQAAQIAGHTSTHMVAETYGHMLNQPKSPEF
jgi:integrase